MPNIYMMGGYAPQMPYSLVLYPYHQPMMPTVMLALQSLTLPALKASIPSLKAAMQFPIRQSSPIGPAEDPDLVMKAYITFLSMEYLYKADGLADAGRILGRHDIDINLLKDQSLTTLQSLGISLGISTYLLKHIREFKAERKAWPFPVPEQSPTQSTTQLEPQRFEHNPNVYSDAIDASESHTDQENIETQFDSQFESQYRLDFIDIDDFEED
jgi:hypothetical protein